MKRRGNRRYYQHHEVLMIRRIRDLLYDQGFTISGARNKLQELVQVERDKRRAGEVMLEGVEVIEVEDSTFEDFEDSAAPPRSMRSAISFRRRCRRCAASSSRSATCFRPRIEFSCPELRMPHHCPRTGYNPWLVGV
jgi:DNA-binding transcriptional MerR regulator